MKFLSPVVWSEGMQLAQHHFQTQSRYLEETADFVFSSLFHCSWGVSRCELDAHALANDTVSLIHARGTMPDGLSFQFPDDPLPDPIKASERFSAVQESQRVLLTIPPHRTGQANCAAQGEDGSETTRFVADVRTVADETTGTDEKPVSLARKNFHLVLDGEPTDDLVTLPLARILRDHRGQFVYDPDFIPPCVQIGASERLLSLTARLVDILDAKSDTMRREREARQLPLAEYASREILNFWITHAVHAGVAPLRHHLQTRSAHPERLYVDLARLAGALCTFSMDAHPRDLPPYDHEAPSACFNALEQHIRRLVDIFLPTNAVPIPLRPAETHFFQGDVTDKRCLSPTSRWYLGVRSSAGRGELLAEVPRLIKVCSGGEDIVKIVERALPGLTLEHEPNPPSAISPRVGTQYFHVRTNVGANKEGTAPWVCWQRMNTESKVGVYVPAAIPEVELDLIVLLEV